MRDFFIRRTETEFGFVGSGVFGILLVYAARAGIWYFALWFASFLLFRAVLEFLAYYFAE
jgi:hypothetical protein